VPEFSGIEVFGRQPSSPRRRTSKKPAKKPRRRARSERSGLGLVSIAAAVATVIVTSVGIGTSMARNFEAGILFAYLATFLSVVAVLGGAAAVVMGRGRAWGALAILIGILASPPILTRLLDWASGLG
jgi:hypothetical protein